MTRLGLPIPLLLIALLSFSTRACREHSPSSAPSSPPPTRASSAPAPGSVSATRSGAPPASAAVAPPQELPHPAPESSTENPPLFDDSGRPLPQTEDKPHSDSPGFLRRVALLVDAIRKDQPELARDAFFPRVAYEQVKAIQDPARDWERRLFAAFERNIHDYHRALGADAEGATFAGVLVPEAKSRWMKPGAEGNRVGYYRVLRSQLLFGTPSGKHKTFEITSMISWRGEWYVVHLNGFK